VNICIVTQQFKNVISGVGLHAANLTKALLKEGHSVTLLLPEDQAPDFTSEELTVVTVRKPKFSASQARWLALSFSFGMMLRRLESKNEFDLIHFTDARESFLCSTRTPIIGNVNDTYSAELLPPSEYKKYYPDWLFRWLYYCAVHLLESRRLQRLDLIIANSRFTAETIAKAYPNTTSKIRHCYKSVDVLRYQKVRENRKTEREDLLQPIILFIGSNMHRKGVPDLIKAASGVVKKFPQVKFIVAGGDHSAGHLKELCSQYNVEQNFRFVGWKSQEDLLEVYQQATVFVMPSLTEALGVTFLEAMAAGVPVIGTEVGGIPEIIQNGINGLLVPVGSPLDLEKAIIRLLEDASLRKRLAGNAFSTLSKFDVSNMMKCTFKLYREILGRDCLPG